MLDKIHPLAQVAVKQPESAILPASAASEAVGAARSTQQLTAKAARYLGAGQQGTDSTQRAYAGDWKRFSAWCEQHGAEPLPAGVATLILFVTDLADQGRKVATIQRHVAAVVKAHRLSQLASPADDPNFKAVLQGIARVEGKAQQQAQAFTMAHFKRSVRDVPQNGPKGLRDRVLLLLGLAGAFRREELVGLNIEQLRFGEEALIVSMGRSKTNQTALAQEKAIFYSADRGTCPVRQTRAWVQLLEQQGRTHGPLFVSLHKGERLSRKRLSTTSLNAIVKRYLGGQYSAHSLRASFVTIAKLNGADDAEVMNQTKHKTPDMIRRYTRLDTIVQQNAGKKLGL